MTTRREDYIDVINVWFDRFFADYEVGIVHYKKEVPGNRFCHPDDMTPDEPAEYEYEVLPPNNEGMDEEEILPTLTYEDLLPEERGAIEEAIDKHMDRIDQDDKVAPYE